MWPYPKHKVYAVSKETMMYDMGVLDSAIAMLGRDSDGEKIHSMNLDWIVDEMKETSNTLYKALKLKEGTWCPMCLKMPIWAGSGKLCFECAKKYGDEMMMKKLKYYQ